MESAEIVRGIVSETNPDVIIAVDALAARNSKRLNRTIQIADTGIHPGSGVGNHRNGMTMETLGVPVIGIGVPTVVDAATIVNDTMENFIRALESSDSLKGVGEVLRSYNAGEKYEFVKELISPHLNGMFARLKMLMKWFIISVILYRKRSICFFRPVQADRKHKRKEQSIHCQK